MGQEVISDEVAEEEFLRFVTTMRLDVNPKGWDDADLKSFKDCKNKIVAAMQAGDLVIDEKGQPIYTPVYGDKKPITFYRPTGATLMATDAKKKEHEAAKTFAALADMTRETVALFSKMDLLDLKVCQSILLLFLA
jgi:hypothetical protein